LSELLSAQNAGMTGWSRRYFAGMEYVQYLPQLFAALASIRGLKREYPKLAAGFDAANYRHDLRDRTGVSSRALAATRSTAPLWRVVVFGYPGFSDEITKL